MLTRLCIDMERLEYLPPVFPWVGLTEFNKFGNLLINWPFDMCSFSNSNCGCTVGISAWAENLCCLQVCVLTECKGTLLSLFRMIFKINLTEITWIFYFCLKRLYLNLCENPELEGCIFNSGSDFDIQPCYALSPLPLFKISSNPTAGCRQNCVNDCRMLATATLF